MNSQSESPSCHQHNYNMILIDRVTSYNNMMCIAQGRANISYADLTLKTKMSSLDNSVITS